MGGSQVRVSVRKFIIFKQSDYKYSFNLKKFKGTFFKNCRYLKKKVYYFGTKLLNLRGNNNNNNIYL